MCEGEGGRRGGEGCGGGGGECVRVREREGYPLHCCVTGNLIEREREGGRKAAGEGGERERERKERRNAKAASGSRCCWNYRGLGRAVGAARPSLQSCGEGGGGGGGQVSENILCIKWKRATKAMWRVCVCVFVCVQCLIRETGWPPCCCNLTKYVRVSHYLVPHLHHASLSVHVCVCVCDCV